MHGVSSSLSLEFLAGACLIQVCLGEHQVQFHFHPAGSIAVEGDWELLDADGGQLDGRHLETPRPPYQLHRLLGQRVVASEVAAPDWFALKFESGDLLRIFDRSDEYEAFSVDSGGLGVDLRHAVSGAAELERRIAELFPTCPVPSLDEIAAPDDDTPEARDLRGSCVPLRWQRVPYETLMYWRGDLSWFSAQVWAYYLPALLTASLRKESADLMQAAVNTLTPRAEESSLQAFNQRLARLDEPQRQVLRDYVHLVDAYLEYDDDPAEDPRPFWDGLIATPGGIAVMPGTEPPRRETG